MNLVGYPVPEDHSCTLALLWITSQNSIDVESSAKVKTYVFPD